ncbi:MAG: hypothetical protein PHI97_23475 [Desulfobulbus sp.]|nr:hypothetical protein [Desulfobulbus sp.]
MVRFVLLLSFLLTASPTLAASQVAGRYIPGQDNTIALHITVQRPAPAAFIVLQKMGPGLSLVAATPPPVGEHRGGSAVKWLFKRPRPGQLVVKMQFDQPVAPSQLEGSISYRQPENGSMVLSRIGE